MQMSRTETEFLRPHKYDIYIRDSLIAYDFGKIIRCALPSGNILARRVFERNSAILLNDALNNI